MENFSKLSEYEMKMYSDAIKMISAGLYGINHDTKMINEAERQIKVLQDKMSA